MNDVKRRRATESRTKCYCNCHQSIGLRVYRDVAALHPDEILQSIIRTAFLQSCNKIGVRSASRGRRTGNQVNQTLRKVVRMPSVASRSRQSLPAKSELPRQCYIPNAHVRLSEDFRSCSMVNARIVQQHHRLANHSDIRNTCSFSR